MRTLLLAMTLAVACTGAANADAFCSSLVGQIQPAAQAADRIRDQLNNLIKAKNFKNGGCALAAQAVAAYKRLHTIEQPFFSHCMNDNRIAPLIVTAVERETKSTLWATKIDEDCHKR